MIIHNIIVVQWLLIKILSAVINDWEQIKVIVPGGCYLDIIIIRKIDQKSKCCGTFDVRILPDRLEAWDALRRCRYGILRFFETA